MWRAERRSGVRILLINPLPMHMNINSTCYLLTAPSLKDGAEFLSCKAVFIFPSFQYGFDALCTSQCGFLEVISRIQFPCHIKARLLIMRDDLLCVILNRFQVRISCLCLSVPERKIQLFWALLQIMRQNVFLESPEPQRS